MVSIGIRRNHPSSIEPPLDFHLNTESIDLQSTRSEFVTFQDASQLR